MATFKDLIVWQKSHHFVLKIYGITKFFPREEIYGLTNQMRRAAYSVPANIVEGKKKKTKAHQIHFYNISDTSLEELKYYLILSKDLNYITEEEYKILISKSEEVGRMIAGFIKHIGSK